MMIQNSNPISVLQGLETGGAIQQGSPVDTAGNATFTAGLLQQIALLQGNIPGGLNASSQTETDILSSLLGKGGFNQSNFTDQEVQDFAAFIGKTSPPAKNTDQGINLGDTLNALSEIMQYLQSLHTDSTDSKINSPGTDILNTETKTGGQGVSDVPSVEQADLSVDSSNTKDAVDQSRQQPADPAALAAMSGLIQPVQSSQSMTREPQVQDQQTAVSAVPDHSGLASVFNGKDEVTPQKKTGQSTSGDSKFFVPQTLGDQQAPVLANAAAGAGIGQENHPQNSGREPQAQTERSVENLNLSTQQNVGMETDKMPNGMAAAGIAQLNQAVSVGKPVEAPPMSQHLNHPDWNQELGQKLIWMHKQDIPSAELRLNPQHLGPISIKIDVSQDQATVSFTAQHAEVRDAIEAAIPKLREMLGGQQLNLADVNVSQQQSEQKQARDFFQAASDQGRGNKGGQNAEDDKSSSTPAVNVTDEINTGRAVVSNGLLSLFA